ncbi:MAG: DinB family protein [Bacteroidota bacterium]
MTSGIESYIERLDNAFHGNPWFGHPVLQTVESASDIDINFHLPNGNSIGQIVEHMLNWRIFTLEKVKGNEEYDIEINSLLDWNKDKTYSQKDFLDIIQKLKATQNELVHLLHQHTDTDWLETKVPGKEYSFSFLIEGIIQHDIYHTGQIAMLKSGR